MSASELLHVTYSHLAAVTHTEHAVTEAPFELNGVTVRTIYNTPVGELTSSGLWL
jgi:hypothetical protein